MLLRSEMIINLLRFKNIQMKKITQYLMVLALIFSAQNMLAQDSNEQKIDRLKIEKETIVAEEKEMLKAEVEAIIKRLDSNEISQEEADKLKQEAAKKRALNIENRTVIIDNKIALLARNDKEYFDEFSIFGVTISSNDDSFSFKHKNKPIKYDRRTTSDLVIAFGFNNAILEGEKLDDSPYKFFGSRFFEMGWAWKTRILNESNAIRIKYGFSIQSNGLKLTDNRYFVQNGNETTFEVYPYPLKKAKLNITNLIFPAHIEFGPSRKTQTDSYVRYSTRNQFKMGLGGYFGFNIGTYQKLKYTADGDKSKEKIDKNYNTSDLVYGLSGYIAFNDVGLYVKYELSPLFKDQILDQNNVSLGLRFDMN